MDDLKERRGYRKMEEALERCVWKTCFGGRYGSAVTQITG